MLHRAGSPKAGCDAGTRGADGRNPPRKAEDLGIQMRQSPLPDRIILLLERFFLYILSSKEGFGQKRGCPIPKAGTCRNV